MKLKDRLSSSSQSRVILTDVDALFPVSDRNTTAPL